MKTIYLAYDGTGYNATPCAERAERLSRAGMRVTAYMGTFEPLNDDTN